MFYAYQQDNQLEDICGALSMKRIAIGLLSKR